MTPATQATTIVVRNQLVELERMSEAIETFGKSAGLGTKPIFELTLAVNEIVTNIISYAYDDRREHEIVIRLAIQPGEVTVEVEDDGHAFDPLRVPQPFLDGPLAERSVGGLGMHLVRKVTDALEYHRREDKNVLVLRKRIGTH
jgi:serine/threonine-protein kinase RsbW